MSRRRNKFTITPCQVPALTSRPSLNRLDLLTKPYVLMREGNFASRLCYYFSYAMTANRDTAFTDVTKRVAASSRVREAVKKSADQDIQRLRLEGHEVQVSSLRPVLEAHHTRRVRTVLQQMRTRISSSLLTIAGWILFKLLSKILTSIQYSKKQVDRIKQVRKGCRYPILYLPVHRSHLDYILVSFILHMNGVKPPLVAAGDNLNIPFFGNLMKGLGAFFIKRKLDPKEGQKDHIYRAVLEAYMTENLRSGQSVEFFLEGGRSRTGKALMPKAGLLSVVVNAVLNNDVEDVCVVPVGISYDKLIDGSFIAEQLGKAKVRESFTLAAKAVWATLRSNFGSARVDFGTPFSLKDYLRSSSSEMVPCIMHSDSDHKNYYCDAGGDRADLRSVSSSASLYGLEVIVEEDKRQVIQQLADHVVHDASNASAIMSTQMLAFVLLTSYRKGATLRQLIPAMTWLKKELTGKGRDVGFSGDTAAVVRHASTLLGRDLVTTETIQMAWSSGESLPDEPNSRVKKIVLVKPATKVPAVLELQYYSNSVASSFALESIVVNSLYCLFEWGVDAVDEIATNNNSIDRQNLINTALELCNILKYEFILAPPCITIEVAVNNVIDDFINSKGLLKTHEPPSHKPYLFDFDDDDGYVPPAGGQERLSVLISSESVELLRFYRSVVGPYIESYWLASKTLFKLVGKTIDNDLFASHLIETAKEQLRQGLVCYQESIAADPLKNSVNLFENMGVLERKNFNGARIVNLTDAYNTDEAIIEVIRNIEKFKK